LEQRETKVCSSCITKLPIKEFGRNKSQRDGYHYYCKPCVKNKAESNKEKNKAWREKNKEELKAYQQKYRKDNRERINEYQRNRPIEKKRKANCSEKKKQREKQRRQDDDYKKNRSKYYKKKYREDEQFRIKKLLESRLRWLFEKDDITIKSKNLIGCTIPNFKAHIESKFIGPMQWDNYATVWCLHFIIPFSQFDLSDPEQQRLCLHYTNIEPLSIRDSKGQAIDKAFLAEFNLYKE
jgi:hypothetical protein